MTIRRLAPLRVRLPVTVALLLAVCTGSVGAVAYRVVRASVTAATVSRLRFAADRLAGMMGPAARRVESDAQRIAVVPAVRSWLANASSTSSTSSTSSAAAAAASLDSLRRATPQTSAVILMRPSGQRLVSGDTTPLSDSLVPQSGVGRFYRFYRDGAAVRYAAAAAVVAGHDTIGRLVVVHSLSSANGAALIGGLVGPRASFLIGNDDGSLWTDFERAAPAPVPASAMPSRRGAARSRDIERDTLGAVVLIPNTPWALWVGQARATALAPANAVAKELALLALIVIVVGTGVAWWLMRRLTAPLDELAGVADGLAAGDYTRRVTHAPSASDEVGRVAAAFNAMAARIDANHTELENQVSERTMALEQALFDLQVAQDEVVRRERLAMLGQLAGGVGHELRNPLGVMTNAVYVLETILADPSSNPMVGQYLGILRGQIALSEKLVADLLDFARTKPAQRTPVSIETLVHHQLGRLGPTNGIAVSCEIPNDVPLVDVDPVQIGQVIFNLVTNAVQAIEAMPTGGGSLRCSARVDGDGRVALDVADTGAGIPPDAAQRIFEPLFTTKARGLGLGLTVSRMLAQNNGGSLTFESQVGVGTTFTLSMPVARAAAAVPAGGAA